MRSRLYLSCRLHVRAWGILAVLAAICQAAVIDRVAVVVGKTVFTQSEVDDEARLSELEAGEPLDLSAAQRKQAAERLVDQELLREEMSATQFQAQASDADALLRSFRQRQRFPSLVQYRAALARYGVTEDALKQRLVWEVSLLRFTDQRFKTFAEPVDAQSANRTEGAQAAPDTIDQLMDAWLKQQRADTRIVSKQEAFQ
jgi:SurA N-terminal domain